MKGLSRVQLAVFMLAAGWVMPVSVDSATIGTVRFYLHAEPSEENPTYNSMLPSVTAESNTQDLGTDDSTQDWGGAPPCEASGFTYPDNTVMVNEETDSAERCVATFFSPILGSSMQMDNTDTNAIFYSLWASEEGNCTTCVLRARLYEYVEPGGTYNLINTSDSSAVTAGGVTNITWSSTPDSSTTVDAGNRLVLVVTMDTGTGEDTSGTNPDTINVNFDRLTAAPAYLQISYTYTTADKPNLGSGMDDDFDVPNGCGSSCDGDAISIWTMETSGNTATETLSIDTGLSSGSTGWLTLTDVKTADLVPTSLANYTYIYQSVLTGDGTISTQVSSSHATYPTTDPRDLAGLLMRFSANTNFLILQTYYDGANNVVEVNNSGVLTGTTATITGNANNILLKWIKTGTDYQAQYCASDTTDCTVDGNWTNLGGVISKAGLTLDQVGLTSFVEWVTGTNIRYTSAFEWFHSTFQRLYVWDGGGGNANWNTAANWTNDTVPGVNNVAIFDGTCVSNCSPTVNVNPNVAGIIIKSSYAGTITQTNGIDITLGVEGYIQNGGTFTGGNSNINMTANWTFTGGTFNAGTTNVVFGGSPTINSGSMSFNNVTINTGGDVTISGTMNINGQLTVTDSNVISGGVIAVQGNVTTTDAAVSAPHDATIYFNGTGNQTLQVDGAGGTAFLPSVTINKTMGTLTIQDTINMPGDWTYINGTVDAGTSTIGFFGSQTISAGTMSFYNAEFNTGGNVTISGTMDINGTMTLTDVNILDQGVVTVAGNFIHNDTTMSTPRGTSFILDGNNNQTLMAIAGADWQDTALTITKTGGTVTLASDFSLDGPFSLENLIITSGTLDQGASYNLTTAALTIGSSGVLYNVGAGDLTLGGDVANSGTIILDGSGIGCGGSNSIIVQSSSPGAARSWSGSGYFEVQDVVVTDQTGPLTAYSSTQGSGATWTFINTCTTKVWDGGGIDGTCGGAGTANNWSCADNWSDDTIPIVTDTVLFTSLSTKNADIDISINVTGVELTDGYTGTLTQESGNSITLGEDGYTQSTGVFIGGDSNIDVNGTFALSGGSFTNTTDSLNVSGNFTLTLSGTFINQNGQVILDGDLFFADATSPQQDLGQLVIGSSPDTTTLTTNMTASSLTIDAADVLVTDGYNVIISGDVDINGALNAANGSGGNSTVYVGGSWDVTGGTFTNTNSTVNFTGTNTHTIISDTKAFNNFTVNSGLLAYWKFDEADYSASVVDHTGNGYNGTPSGAAGNYNASNPTKTLPSLDFPNLYAKDFDGTDDVINFGPVNEIGNVNALTMTAWVQRRAANSVIFIGKQETGVQDDINIELWSDGNIYFAISDNGFSTGSVALNDTSWHHVALVFDGTQSGNANRLKGFVDGIQQTLSFSGTVPALTPAMVTSFVVGQDGEFGGAFADGFVDDVRVYTRVLSTSEVQQLASGNPGSGTYVLEDALDVNGTVMMVSGTLDVKSGENNPINVGGNWLGYADFNARNGIVTFDGINQTIGGSTIFYDLEKNDVSDNGTDVSLTMEAGSTQTIQSNLTLNGLDSNDRVNIASTSSQMRHNIHLPNGSQNVSWVDVSGSEALGNDIVAADSIDSGNNDDTEPAPHWDFSGATEVLGCFKKSNLNQSIFATETDILELDVGCFENGSDYLIFGGIGGMRWDDTGVRLETSLTINSSTTHLTMNEEIQEGPAADRGSSFMTMGRRTWGTNETLDLVSQRIVGTGNGDADESYLMALDTSSLGTENTDWFWNENTIVAGLPTSLGTAYAQITFTPDGTSDYLVIANMRATIDTLEEEIEMDIFDGTTQLSRHIRDSEDVADEQQMFAATLLEAPSANPVTLSVRARTSLADTVADHHSSRLLIIRLNYYDAHSCQEVDENVAITTSYVVRATTDLTLNTAGDVVVFGYGYFSTTAATSEVSAHLRQDATTLYQITSADPNNGDGRIGVWQISDFMPTMWFDIIPAVDTNAHTYDFSYLRSGTVGSSSIKSMVCAWSRKTTNPNGFTWSGSGNWSTGGNWLGGIAPGLNDIAVFNATSTNNSTIDTDISVDGISINSGYTGTITQGGGNSVTIGASGFTQSAGVFIGGDSIIDVNGSFSLNGGSFMTTSVNMSVSGNFILSSTGTFANPQGTLIFDGDQYFTDSTASLQNLGKLVIGQSPDTTTLTTDMLAVSLQIMPADVLVTDGYDIYLTGTMDIDGALNAGSGPGGNTTIHVGGLWDMSGGTFTNINSTVMFTGTSALLTITSDSKAFNNVIINDGLLGYWKLDEGSENSNPACSSAASFDDACDSSGYGLHGEWIVTPLASIDVPALHFNNPGSIDIDDASLEYVNIKDNEIFDLDVSGQYSWSVWINSDDLSAGSGWPTLWSQTIDTSNFFYFYAQTLGSGSGTTGGSITNGIAVWWTSPSGSVVTEAENVVSVGEWYHVAVTYDGSLAQANRFRIYVNGQDVTGGTVSSGTISSIATTDIRIGSNEPFPSDNYDGKIDEMRYYNRLLSATEIQRLAAGNMPGTARGTYTLQDNLDVNGTLTLNAGELHAGTNRDISVGRSWMNHGGIFTATNGDVFFDGTSSDALILSGSQTFYNVDVTGSGIWTLQDDVSISNILDVSAGTLTYASSPVIEPVNIHGNTTITGGTFAGQSTRFRHDGDLSISSGTYTAPTDVVEIDGSFTHSAGTFTNAGSTVMFTGTGSQTIDSTGGTVFQDVIINDGLVAYWKMEEQVSPSADASGYGNAGTWQGSPSSTTDLPDVHFEDSRSLSFDANADFVNVLVSDSMESIYENDQITVALWTRNDAVPVQYDGIIGNPSDDSWANGWGLYYNAAGVINFYISLWNVNEASASITAQQWNHVVGLYDGTNVRIFVNGVEGAADSYAGEITDSQSPVTIGKLEGSGAYNIVGKVDEVRIYNRALSLSEIQALANGNMPGAGIGTYTLQTNLDIDGTLRLNAGTLDTGSNRQINLGGDWENFGGVFVEQAGTVIFDGADQQIPASETFYNLTKTLGSVPSRTLTFGRQSTVTISNTLSMQGFDGSSRLNLRSSSVGVRFNVNVLNGTQTVRYTDVRDSEALGNNIRANNSTDSGNTDKQEATPHWIFGPLRGAVMIVD